MERSLSILSSLMILGCFAAGYAALRKFAAADDVQGLIYCGVGIASGLTAHRLLGGESNDE